MYCTPFQFIFTGAYRPHCAYIRLPGSLIPVGRYTAVGTNSSKKDIVSGNFKPVTVFDTVLQTVDIRDLNIKDPATFFAFYMTVLFAYMIETVCSSRNFQFSDHSHLRQQIQISVYCGFADIRVCRGNLRIYLVSRCVRFKSVDNVQHQRALDSIMSCHR